MGNIFIKIHLMSIKLIINPIAGNRKYNELIIKRAKGKDIDVFITEKRGDAAESSTLAVSQGYKKIIVAGGDGTVNEVINGIAYSDSALGIIPTGTKNVFALENKLPINPLKAFDVALNGKKINISLGLANNIYFSLMAGIGFDAKAIENTNLEIKKYIGVLAYYIAGIYTIFSYKQPEVYIELDKKIKTEGYFVVISNSRYYGGRYIIAPRGNVKKDRLDVVIFKKRGILPSILYYLKISMGGKHVNYQDVEYYEAKNINIYSNNDVPVQVDGDIIGNLPMNFSIAPNSLNLIVPG